MRKVSTTGKSIESQTSKRDISTSTEDLGLFALVSTITLSVFGILYGFSIYICCVLGLNWAILHTNLQLNPVFFVPLFLSRNERMKCLVSTNKICLKQKNV